MSDVERYFHETWLGMVQPIDGLVVSIPVLVDAQCMERQPPHVQAKLVGVCPPTRKGEAGPEGYTIANLQAFLSEMLGFAPASFDVGDALPEALSLYVPEGRQTLRTTMALRKVREPVTEETTDTTPASVAGAAYEMLVWELPAGLDLDKPEAVTGSWDYPPAAKFDRLLRHCRVPIGLLTNREIVRLVYAPHGESSGAITFRLDDMVSVGGRPILDAFIMLLSANRFFGVADDENINRTLPGILAESRKRQANVTNDLADQVFEALQILLRGFEAAAERDGRDLLDDALAREGDHLYKGLLTVLLRLVFLLYAEDRGLLPVEQPFYAEHLSVLSLFEQLQADRGAYPDSMSRRFGAWGRLVTLFRAVFLGVSQGDLTMPPRRGSLFNPNEYPFVEGWGPGGSAPITQPEDRAGVKLPTVDDETLFRVLEKLLVLEGQRLSYRALDVEQIGSVYEALMGYHVLRVLSEAMCMKPDRVWVSAEEVLALPATRRAKWLKDTIGVTLAQAEKLSAELEGADATHRVLEGLAKFAAGGRKTDPSLSKARAGQLVLQPGTERRRTSSHYTPRSLSAPIVQRTLEPLVAAMGKEPPSERILNLKVCDPAMGSGAFLVEACRFLADHVLTAWTREGKVETLAAEHGDPLLHARRLVAQRCLYGVDKNDAAVELAKLSLWLVTLSRTLPFTFLDHCLRHGDSLVGLDFDQIRAFHWKRPQKLPSKQLDLFGREIALALDEAIALRQRIGDLGDSPGDDREKARLFWDAQDALDRVRLIGDLVVGAFFAHEKEKDREAERVRREHMVRTWLGSGGPPPAELVDLQRRLRAAVPAFHWMTEFPEVFYADRPDPLDGGRVNHAALMDAFVGNPPFAGHERVSQDLGTSYVFWLRATFPETVGNTDLCAFFFRRTAELIGAHGSIGLIATSTIVEGDTRHASLDFLVDDGWTIFHAVSKKPWPGPAAVFISEVLLSKGRLPLATGQPRLDGETVGRINSRLESGAQREEASTLAANGLITSKGMEPRGAGFFVSEKTREALIERDNNNADRIFKFIGADDFLKRPGVDSTRWVINFGAVDLAAAKKWPDLLAIVEETVRPEREKMPNHAPGMKMKKYWWQFYSEVSVGRSASDGLDRLILIPELARNPVVTVGSPSFIYGNTCCVIALATWTAFGVLQSSVHRVWAALNSSSRGEGGRYVLSRCFETFPFPRSAPGGVLPELEDAGRRLYEFRETYMGNEDVGLTITYNRLVDPTCTDTPILELRRLHEEIDQKVLNAYAAGDPEGRWGDVDVPPFCPMSDEDKKKLEMFEEGVIERLFVLNGKRAEEERLKGLAASGSKPRTRAAPSQARTPKKARGKTAKDQLTLTSSDPDAES